MSENREERTLEYAIRKWKQAYRGALKRANEARYASTNKQIPQDNNDDINNWLGNLDYFADIKHLLNKRGGPVEFHPSFSNENVMYTRTKYIPGVGAGSLITKKDFTTYTSSFYFAITDNSGNQNLTYLGEGQTSSVHSDPDFIVRPDGTIEILLDTPVSNIILKRYRVKSDNTIEIIGSPTEIHEPGLTYIRQCRLTICNDQIECIYLADNDYTLQAVSLANRTLIGNSTTFGSWASESLKHCEVASHNNQFCIVYDGLPNSDAYYNVYEVASTTAAPTLNGHNYLANHQTDAVPFYDTTQNNWRIFWTTTPPPYSRLETVLLLPNQTDIDWSTKKTLLPDAAWQNPVVTRLPDDNILIGLAESSGKTNITLIQYDNDLNEIGTRTKIPADINNVKAFVDLSLIILKDGSAVATYVLPNNTAVAYEIDDYTYPLNYTAPNETATTTSTTSNPPPVDSTSSSGSSQPSPIPLSTPADMSGIRSGAATPAIGATSSSSSNSTSSGSTSGGNTFTRNYAVTTPNPMSSLATILIIAFSVLVACCVATGVTIKCLITRNRRKHLALATPNETGSEMSSVPSSPSSTTDSTSNNGNVPVENVYTDLRLKSIATPAQQQYKPVPVAKNNGYGSGPEARKNEYGSVHEANNNGYAAPGDPLEGFENGGDESQYDLMPTGPATMQQ